MFSSLSKYNAATHFLLQSLLSSIAKTFLLVDNPPILWLIHDTQYMINQVSKTRLDSVFGSDVIHIGTTANFLFKSTAIN
jgi:hypothetical protein